MVECIMLMWCDVSIDRKTGRCRRSLARRRLKTSSDWAQFIGETSQDHAMTVKAIDDQDCDCDLLSLWRLWDQVLYRRRPS